MFELLVFKNKLISNYEVLEEKKIEKAVENI